MTKIIDLRKKKEEQTSKELEQWGLFDSCSVGDVIRFENGVKGLVIYASKNIPVRGNKTVLFTHYSDGSAWNSLIADGSGFLRDLKYNNFTILNESGMEKKEPVIEFVRCWSHPDNNVNVARCDTSYYEVVEVLRDWEGGQLFYAYNECEPDWGTLYWGHYK